MRWIFGPELTADQMSLRQSGAWIALLLPALFLAVMWAEEWRNAGCMAALRFGKKRRFLFRIEAESLLAFALYLLWTALISGEGASSYELAAGLSLLLLHLILMEHLILFLKLWRMDTVSALLCVILAEGVGTYLLSGTRFSSIFPCFWGMLSRSSLIQTGGYDVRIVVIAQTAAVFLCFAFAVRKYDKI